SPDGVRYRVRTERHRPEAEIAFWQEALRERMQGAGYRLLGEERLAHADGDGFLLELSAPWGEADWLYLVAVYPRGRRLVIAAAAGPVREVERHRDALRTAMVELER